MALINWTVTLVPIMIFIVHCPTLELVGVKWNILMGKLYHTEISLVEGRRRERGGGKRRRDGGRRGGREFPLPSGWAVLLLNIHLSYST